MFWEKFKKTESEEVDVRTQHFPLDLENGLTSNQVQDRISSGYVNKIKKHVSKSYWKIFYDNIFNFFNILLILIAVLMIVAKIEITAYGFLIILIINMVIGLYQDIHARHLIDKLRVVSYPVVEVLRDGKIQEIPANEVVFSDIIQLSSGSQIVCDGTLMKGSIEVNESMLTGESVGVIKTVDSEIWSGSFVTSGHCLYRVDKVGKQNYAEKLQAQAKEFKRAKSEILNTLNYIFRIIAGVVIVLGIALFASFIAKGNMKYPGAGNIDGSPFQETVRAISGSLVAMIPTGMYLLTSVTLAIGVIRLAKHRVLVQSMYSIEMLARSDTLCLDKTGTITDGTMAVKTFVQLSEMTEEQVAPLLHTLIDATQDNNSSTMAILQKYGESKSLSFHGEIPFNSKRKYSAVHLSDGRTVVLGAREFLGCKDPSIIKKCNEFERQGYRILLTGICDHHFSEDEAIPELKFLGIITLEDHIREDASEIIGWFNSNDVTIKVISGDNPISVSQIAQKVGVPGADKFVSLDGMSLDEVKLIANEYTVFGRVSPEQKKVLVEAMQDAGHTVAMTGDGVNDILAMKVADCSIAMASGTDATKNVAHLVALDSNFGSLPKVVSEGRRVINNLQRTCTLFLTKTIFAIVMTFIFFIAGLARITEKDFLKYPFITNSMYIWEFFTIGIGSFFLSIQPNEERLKSSFLSNILQRTLPAAFIQIIMPCVFFLVNIINPQAYHVADAYNAAIAMSIIAFSFGSILIFVRTCWPFDKYRSILIVCILAVVALAVWFDKAIVYDKIKPEVTNNSLFNIDYRQINNKNWMILVGTVAAAIPLYICASLLAQRIDKKIGDKSAYLRGKINANIKRN